MIVRQPITTNYQINSYEHREWEVVYLNRFGVFDSMLFNRVSSRTVTMNTTQYTSLQSRPSQFNVSNSTSKTLTRNASEEWTLNTDLLDESQNLFMEELFESDRWFMINNLTSEIIPVMLIDKKFEEKLSLYSKASIQWTLKFKGGNSKIFDIR